MKALLGFLIASGLAIVGIIFSLPGMHKHTLAHELTHLELFIASASYALWTISADITKFTKIIAFMIFVFALLFIFPLLDDFLTTLQKEDAKQIVESTKLEENKRYAGILSPKDRQVLFDSKDSSSNPIVQIGECTQFNWGGKAGEPLFILPGSRIVVEKIDGQVKLSTSVTDMTGQVAELIRNEWKIIPPPGVFDRNYDDNSVEVVGRSGRVILQVTSLTNIVRIQGEFRGKDGEETILFCEKPHASASIIYIQAGQSIEDMPQIRRIFRYPSDLHLHEASLRP